MKRILVVLMALTLGLGFAGKAAAAPVTVDWTTNGGDASFVSDTINFTGFTANSILAFTGTGIFHGHAGTNVTGLIEVLLNGTFTSVGTIASVGGASVVLSSLTFPISFTQGTVTGLRLSGSPAAGVPEYHSFAGETITFNSPSAPPTPGVPEPATLLLLGSGLLGLITFRARLR